MNPTSVLDRILLGYAPMFGRWRESVGLRISLFPNSLEARPDVEGLLLEIGEAFAPLPGAEPGVGDRSEQASARVLLSVVGTRWAQGLLERTLPPWLGLAVPVEASRDETVRRLLREQVAAGTWIVARGRTGGAIPEQVRDIFAELLIDARDSDLPSSRFPAPTWVDGVGSLGLAERLFEHGAKGLVGWPRDLGTLSSRDIRAEVPVVVDLMNRVERQEPLDKLERALKADPTLVFRLLRHINSAALGLKVEVTALQQALMLLGYLPLLRWLSRMLLDAAAKEGASRPLVHLSVRRGFLMEHLSRAGRSTTLPPGAASEMFLCGMFSLLDAIMQRPLGELVATLPLPERVRSSLLEPDGPYSLHLRWVEAVESGSVEGMRAALDVLQVAPVEANRALLRGLSAARALDA